MFSCSEEPNDSSGDTPVIYSVSPSETFVSDTVTITGVNFGDISDSSFIISKDKIIRSDSCLAWYPGFIKFVIPPGLASGTISIVANGDTSNSVYLTISELPDIEEITVRGSQFMMGADNGPADEKPLHEVFISKDLFVSRFEVDQRLWRLVMEGNPSIIKSDDLPVHNVSWMDAVEFCNRLSEIQGLITCYIVTGESVAWNEDANGYRLPTEAEWEYTCRSGTTQDFGESMLPDDYSWYNLNSGLNPHPSGKKEPNPSGIYDMHGNIREWCWDYYDSNYYSVSQSTDPSGPATGEFRITRGGSYSDGKNYIRASARFAPDSLISDCGLRLFRTIKN